MALTLKQKKFIEAYLGTANGNATKAAEIAGYGSPMQRGSENVRNREVQEEITRLLRENCMGPEEILSRLTDQARGIGEFVIAQLGQAVRIDYQAMDEAGKLHLIHAVKEKKDGQEVEFYDAQQALSLLGRYHVLFTDKQNTTINGTVRVKSETIILRSGQSDDDGDTEPQPVDAG